MRSRRALLMVILVYVALDLSLPAMPGAFVFEVADSVESIGGGRLATRPAVVPPPTPSPAPPAPQLHHDLPHGRLAGVEPPRLAHPRARSLPRAAGGPSEPSEDPH